MLLFDNEMVADNTAYPEFVYKRQSKKRMVPYVKVSVALTYPSADKVVITLHPASGTKAKVPKIIHSYDVSSKSEAHRTYRSEVRRVLFF